MGPHHRDPAHIGDVDRHHYPIGDALVEDQPHRTCRGPRYLRNRAHMPTQRPSNHRLLLEGRGQGRPIPTRLRTAWWLFRAISARYSARRRGAYRKSSSGRASPRPCSTHRHRGSPCRPVGRDIRGRHRPIHLCRHASTSQRRGLYRRTHAKDSALRTRRYGRIRCHGDSVTYADSGASNHCFANKSDFSTYELFDEPKEGQAASREARFKIHGKGTVVKR
ncbi:hypothetical protein BDZ97DRAFT_1799960 [Flammula alnicola]|nr:hypothetical protein BDZ97DRAFT_1834531 [Flammula alnicola]KAF8968325.1 hypothetical protein BDZ97DRAFT_1799960 [Flammula alnicola]